MESITLNWPLHIHNAATSAVRATIDLYHLIEKNIKPTPAKFHYVFNARHMFKIIYGLADVEPNYLESNLFS
jgi:dynein heavy chain